MVFIFVVFIFAVLIFVHLKQNIFHAVLISAHLIEKYNLIKRDKEEEEENEDDASNLYLDMSEQR